MRKIIQIIKTSRGQSYIVKCLECKLSFKIKRWDYKHMNRGKFCSNKCKAKYQKLKSCGKNNPNWKGGKIQIKCKICNSKKMVKRKDMEKSKRKYCSKKCKDEDNSKIIREYYKNHPEHKNKTKHLGDKNGRWLGGKSFEPYSYKFNKGLKEKIKNRDDYKCKMCNKKCKIINIHHIDYNKMNSNKKNLIALCASCHGKVHVKRDYWKKYLLNLI